MWQSSPPLGNLRGPAGRQLATGRFCGLWNTDSVDGSVHQAVWAAGTDLIWPHGPVEGSWPWSSVVQLSTLTTLTKHTWAPAAPRLHGPPPAPVLGPTDGAESEERLVVAGAGAFG